MFLQRHILSLRDLLSVKRYSDVMFDHFRSKQFAVLTSQDAAARVVELVGADAVLELGVEGRAVEVHPGVGGGVQQRNQ